ncbi:hypothetical protein ABVT39_008059 [Epinephelus coioides]
MGQETMLLPVLEGPSKIGQVRGKLHQLLVLGYIQSLIHMDSTFIFNVRLADVRKTSDAKHLFGGAKEKTEVKLLLWSTITSKLLLYPLDLSRILPKTAQRSSNISHLENGLQIQSLAERCTSNICFGGICYFLAPPQMLL